MASRNVCGYWSADNCITHHKPPIAHLWHTGRHTSTATCMQTPERATVHIPTAMSECTGKVEGGCMRYRYTTHNNTAPTMANNTTRTHTPPWTHADSTHKPMETGRSTALAGTSTQHNYLQYGIWPIWPYHKNMAIFIYIQKKKAWLMMYRLIFSTERGLSQSRSLALAQTFASIFLFSLISHLIFPFIALKS